MPPHMPCRHLNYYTCTHALKSVMTYTPTPMYSHSHIETHAYQVLHPYRCSDAVLASIPLSHHHSLAFNPSLRHLQSVYQRCKILPPAPKLSPQPSIPFSLLCTMYNWRDPGEGQIMSEEKKWKSKGWGKVGGERVKRRFCCALIVITDEREGLLWCTIVEPRALVRCCPRLVSLEPQQLLSCSCST